MNPTITNRQIDIIKAIVSEYILTGEPVGSHIIVKAHIMDVSSATVRKEMCILEQMGFLNSPYTSSGRVPTDNAMRLYINNLIDLYEITVTQKEHLESFYKKAKIQIEQLLKRTASLLATTSKNIAVVIAPTPVVSSIKRIELISILDNLVLVVMITGTGSIFQKKIKIDGYLKQDDLYEISRYMNQRVVGYEISDLQNRDLSFFENMGTLAPNLMEHALKILQSLIYNPPDQDVYIDGETNFYEQLLQNLPEKEGIDTIMNTVTNKKFIQELLTTICNNNESSPEQNNYNKVSTQVGLKINNRVIPGIAVLTKYYSVGGKNIGALGIIGSTRMPYDKLIPAVDYSALLLSNALAERSEHTNDDLSKLIPWEV